MKAWKKVLLTVLCLVIVSSVLVGCGSEQQTSVNSNGDENSRKSKVIVDQNQTKVKIDEDVNRVVMTALPLPSIYALTGEPIEKIVGMHPGSKGAIENSIMAKMYPKLLDADTSFIEGTDLNAEELLKLNPDLVFFWGDYTNQKEQLEKAKIPAIGVKTQGGGDPLYTLETWLGLMGQAFDKEDYINDVIDYGKEVKEEVSRKVKDINEKDRVNSLILFRHSEKEITVPGKGHYGQFWIETTGGRNVAKEIDVTGNVNMEQIYKWNPEVIFITSFTPTMPEDLYENNIPGQDWSKVNAVKNKRVYKIPLGIYRWYPPSGDGPLMLKWMAQKQYPDRFDYDMESEIKNYYKDFYNYDIDDKDVKNILNPVKEASKGTQGLSKQKS